MFCNDINQVVTQINGSDVKNEIVKNISILCY